MIAKYTVRFFQQIFSLLSFCSLMFLTTCKDIGNPVNGDPPTFPIEYPAVDSYPSWSPDGLKILYNHYGITKISPGGVHQINRDSAGLWIMNADGSNQRLLIKGFQMYGDWSPDGTSIVFERGGQIHRVPFVGDSLDQSRIRQLTFQGENFFPAWSPDGQWIAYDNTVCGTAIEPPPPMSCGILIVRSDGTEKSFLRSGRWPHWNPRGLFLIFVGWFDSTRGGIIQYDVQTQNSTLLLDARGKDVRSPRYSPDAAKIAFTSQPMNGWPQIWVMNADGTDPKQLTTDGGLEPSWSPDGGKIVFIGWTNRRYNPRQNGTVWIMNADGSNKHQLTFGPDPIR
jgi:Tol biopolymer transport system component